MNPQLKDLIFELSTADEFKLCFCVCDNYGSQLTLKKEVFGRLLAQNIQAVEFSASDGDLVQRIKSASKSADVIILGELDLLNDNIFDEQLRRLNFQRDALIALGIPFSVWLSNARLRRLTTVAPDLWSRRTSTYQFSADAIDKLIRGLFVEASEEIDKKTDSDVGLSLHRLISAQQRVNERVPIRTNDLRSDPDVHVILDSIDELISICKNGRSLEVALLLANLTPLDSVVRAMRGSNPSLPFGNMYDAVLDLAPHIVTILQRYRHDLLNERSKIKSFDLIDYFYRTSRAHIFQALKKSRDSSRFEQSMASEDMDLLKEATSLASFENALAAKRLLEWLKDERDVEDIYAAFTTEERGLLRTLVSAGDIDAYWHRIGVDRKKSANALKQLRQKVAEYLGVSAA